MITHIVFFKLINPEQDNMQKVYDILMGMKGKIDQLQHIQVGTDIVRSDRSWDVALITKFDTEVDLGDYRVHPEHIKVQNRLSAFVELSATVDFKE